MDKNEIESILIMENGDFVIVFSKKYKNEIINFEDKGIESYSNNEKENYDIELKSREGYKVKAHKSVLKMKSEYFNILFSDKYKDNKDEIINFENISYDTLRKSIDFIYTSECDFKNFYEIIECYIFADMIQLKIFEEHIIKNIKSIETVDDIIEINELLFEIKYINGVRDVINYLTDKKTEIEINIVRRHYTYDEKYTLTLKTQECYDVIIKSYLWKFTNDDIELDKLSDKKKLYVIPIKKLYSNKDIYFTFTLSTEEMLISEYGFAGNFDFNNKFKKIDNIKKKEAYSLIYNVKIIGMIINGIEKRKKEINEKKYKESLLIDNIFNKYC